MFPERVIEPLDVIEDIGSGLLPGPVDRASAALGLQRREEAFHRRVVPAFTAPAHAAGDILALQQLLELVAGLLGGFNRSSQHLNHEGVYGMTSKLDAEVDGVWRNALT